MSIKKEVCNLVEFMKQELTSRPVRGYVLGLSGGIDSAVCAALAKRAVDELTYGGSAKPSTEYHLELIAIPIGNHEGDLEVAKEVANSLDHPLRTLCMDDAYKAFLENTQDLYRVNGNLPLVCGNAKARLRMTMLYFAANAQNLMVIGTDNKTETYTGYFTKHGDGAADIFPLSSFTKREVYELGRYLKLPESVLSRAPSAGLWSDQTDEIEMGVPYNYIDNVLESMDWVNAVEYSLEDNNTFSGRLDQMHRASRHKREAPPTYTRGD